MAGFIGDYNCKLDDKGRVALPSAFKKVFQESGQNTVVVKKDIFEQCLILYPLSEWEHQIKILRSKINPYNREHSKFLREFFRGTAEVKLDANNRVLIPKRLLELVLIKKNICLAGQETKIEMWADNLYEDVSENEESFATLAEKVMGDLKL